MNSKSIIEEISRGLATPERGEKIVDYADGRQGKIEFADRPNRCVRARFGQKLYRIPFRSLRWDTVRLRWVWWGLREGRGQPGYDVPLVYRVTVTVNGRRHVRDVEAPSVKRLNWARARGTASVLRELGYTSRNLRYKMASLFRDSAVSVSDVSLVADPASSSYIPFKANQPEQGELNLNLASADRVAVVSS